MIRSLIRYGAVASVLAAAAACDLQVSNPNDAATEQVLASPQEAEAVIGAYYRRWHAGLYGTTNNVWGMANVQSFENYSSLANNAQNARSGIPRPGNDNNISNVAQGEQQNIYYRNHEVARIASEILTRFNASTAADPFTLGSTFGETARDNRAKSFAEFLRGVALGYLALVYDSAAVPTEGQAKLDASPLVGYREVAESAYVGLERAITYANAGGTGGGGFPLPADWISSPTSFTAVEFVKLIRSYRARIRANIARTPAERAQGTTNTTTDWNLVIADAAAGITADHENITNTNTGPFKTWVAQYVGSFPNSQWHQMPPWIIGFGDVSTAYATWIALPLGDRGAVGEFTMVTPDLRFPQGADRAAQIADFAMSSCEAAATACKRYFRNRPASEDQTAGSAWGLSNYDWVRHRSWQRRGDGGTGQNGRIVFFTKAENDLLQAEGHIRLGNFAAAATLINLTRTAPMSGGVARGGGLPAVTGTASGGLAGANCVPKRAVAASNNGGGTVTCGDLMEAMKWEKRLETAYTHFAAWFLDHRGWGDLAEGTPTHWAPPYQDLMARGHPIYSIGTTTPGTGHVAAVSTYGW